MTCLICKYGVYVPGNVTVKLERDNAIILIRDVKAEVCGICGNYLLDQATTRKVLQMAEEKFSTGTELEVIKLKAV